MAIGGPMESISISGRTFAVTGDADVSRKIGGKENEILMNGNGTGRTIQSRVPAGFTGVVVEVDDDRKDQQFLNGVKDAGLPVPVAATYSSGAVWQGNLTITGELAYSNQSTTCQFDLQGARPLSQQ